MSVNKNALLRYMTIDRCLGDLKKSYTLEGLVRECNIALGWDFVDKLKVSKRQIYEDLRFMKAPHPQGYGVMIKETTINGKKYFKYEDQKFSIRTRSLTEKEIETIQDTLNVLSRFNGAPGTEWMQDTMSKLEAITGTKMNTAEFISIQSNPATDWLNNFRQLMKVIPEKIALEVYYKSFKDTKEKKYLFSPYYLKEYNTRWFVIGQCPEYKNLTIFAIDRIAKMRTLKGGYIANENNEGELRYNFDEYFDDVVGVSVRTDDPVEKVLLKIRNDSWPYIETKPFHGSQKRWRDGDEENFTGIQLEVQINYELIANVLYRGSAIRVIEPESLIAKIRNEVTKMNEFYL